MFDPQTTTLIQQVPELPELDRDRLPEELTRAFAAIVAYRVRLAGNTAPPPADLKTKLDEFRRLAATFEAMVALLPERDDRRSAAFVAAQAHHLLILARRAIAPFVEEPPPLRAEGISPTVSALLLFLIANQPSDAMDMARMLPRPQPEENQTTSLLAGALSALAAGHLTEITRLAARQLLVFPEDFCDAAVEALYSRILQGLAVLARFQLDAQGSRGLGVQAIAIFREVQRLSAREALWPVTDPDESLLPAISTFPGPHHLATLLIAAADFLGGCALSAVPPPPGIAPTTWSGLLKTIISDRPFLWPNHQQALAQGFLSPGTSAIVSFPTGAGKTTLSELKTAAALALGRAVVYLAPTHALVAQTKADLRRAFPPEIPIRDSLLIEDFYAEIGETFETSNAQVVVMTPERCLALLSLGGAEFSAVRLVIFDECHLIHPKGPGQNRRSLDAMLAVLHLHEAAPNADWLLLSAMMENAPEIAGWLQELIGRPCLPLNLDWKPTRQARGCLVYNQKDVEALNVQLTAAQGAARHRAGKLSAPGVGVQRELSARPYGFFCLQQTWQSKSAKDYVLLPLLDQNVPLTANISPKGRGQQRWYLTPNKNAVAARLAAQCAQIGLKVLLFVQNTTHVGSIAKQVDEIVKGETAELTDREKQLLRIASDEMGAIDSVLTAEGCAGCHHSNMLPAERELAESLFRRADGIQVLAATPTLAQGMNLPADIVFIVGDERFDQRAKGFAQLEAHELLNAAGRAGRAGHVAQGMVIVLPHTLVDFDPQRRKIGKGWVQLQELFSSADQCLAIEDPIRHFIDRVQDAAAQTDPDVRYFLRRIPRGDEASKSFLRSTFGAWQAKQKHKEKMFQQIIDQTLLRRLELAPLSRSETWRDELAFRTGISVELIEALHHQLLVYLANPPCDLEWWVRWFFGWLASSQQWLDAVFGHRLSPELRGELGQHDLFGGKLAEIVWAWMSGEPLRSLNTRLGGPAANPGHCAKARKFVLKLVPELAFAAGLATRIRRKQIEEAGQGRMPLVLATLALCVREGVAEPEIAALRIINPDNLDSRSALRARWKQVRRFVVSRDDFESFNRTRERVAAAEELRHDAVAPRS